MNSLGIEFVLIDAGSFQTGQDTNFEQESVQQSPRREVAISRPFYLGKFELAQAQWEAIMGQNPSHFKGLNNPVEQVS
ncbi:MAG: SUMF1/EgtB/PvdO family nonheme iron enzyme, partial [Deltaproteobacteria bacterium]|nr:SUMF1/EgtB/PvdO family nonheme iron enzyme [Deltaproteobacteria bacterium]